MIHHIHGAEVIWCSDNWCSTVRAFYIRIDLPLYKCKLLACVCMYNVTKLYTFFNVIYEKLLFLSNFWYQVGCLLLIWVAYPLYCKTINLCIMKWPYNVQISWWMLALVLLFFLSTVYMFAMFKYKFVLHNKQLWSYVFDRLWEH